MKNLIHHRIAASLVLAFICTAAANLRADSVLVLTNSDFSGWTSAAYAPYPAQSVSFPNTGGNSGSYLRVQTSTSLTTATVSYNTNFTYNPATGGIHFLSFSTEIIEINTFGQGMAFELALIQNGTVYSGGYQITGGGSSTWTLRGVGGLTQNDFLDGNGLHPDFSTAGGVIAFGLKTGNSGGAGITVGYDNLKVQLQVAPVPEPTTMALTGMGLLAVVLAARRNKV